MLEKTGIARLHYITPHPHAHLRPVVSLEGTWSPTRGFLRKVEGLLSWAEAMEELTQYDNG